MKYIIFSIEWKRIIADDDGDDTISLGEFKKAMKELRITLDDGQLRLLFNYFDGGID